MTLISKTYKNVIYFEDNRPKGRFFVGNFGLFCQMFGGDFMELKRKSFFKKLLEAPKFYRKQAAILKKYRGGRRVALALTWRYLMDRTIAERR